MHLTFWREKSFFEKIRADNYDINGKLKNEAVSLCLILQCTTFVSNIFPIPNSMLACVWLTHFFAQKKPAQQKYKRRNIMKKAEGIIRIQSNILLSWLGVKVQNMKMDFNTGGTWRWVGQWTLMMKIYDFFFFYLAKSFIHPV